MRAFKRLCAVMIAAFLILAAVLNVILIRSPREHDGIYRVEAKRLTDELRATGTCDLQKYPHITGLYSDGDLYRSDAHYLILEAGGTLYRAEYVTETGHQNLFAVNCILGILFLLMTALLLYIRRQIILPFGRLNQVPQELARGNLAVELPEEKSRFFGKFTWGVNLLREQIEDSRRKEITVQRDKKLLLLSLSHDIKTPLAAIKLNAKALAKGLYSDPEKCRAAAERIDRRADEIEGFVSEITNAAGNDFMQFEVTAGELFLSQLFARICARYVPQFADTGTAFDILPYDDCLLSCDPDRLAECVQNLIENAIKYGDGKRIQISTDQMDGCELITVRNTGCSLDEKELPQIFESFRRGSNAEGIQGNGLGLFICKRLMSLMGGEVYAEIADGCFAVTLVVRLA